MSFYQKSIISSTLLLFVALFTSCKNEEKKELPPIQVPYIVVEQHDVPIYREFPAQVYGDLDVVLTARVDGILTGIHFKEGDKVKKGQLLYTIDPLEYDAKVQAQKGQVEAIRSVYMNSQNELKRIKPLAEMNAVSKRELDAVSARVDNSKASLESAEASLRNYEIERGYCNIISPFDGYIGISNARLGDYISRGGNSAKLNTVSKTDAVRLRFAVSESSFLKYQNALRAGHSEISDLEMILSDGSVHPYKGKLNIADTRVDPTTGTVGVEVMFPNPQGTLRSGLFATIRMSVAVEKNAISIPQKTITEMQGIYQVNVIDKSNKVTVRVVEVGEKVGINWIVKKGLTPGDKVAILGNIFVQPGSTVNPTPYKEEQATNPNQK
ncbi:MAG: efflux RND transporter periplasmic adaptor subunit [Flavobacterium sp.]